MVISAVDGQPKEQRKQKILIVDDMLMHLETAKLYLEMAGYEVFCASNTQHAWDLLIHEKPDLMFLDVVLPGENGLLWFDKVQTSYPDTGVVIMTAFGNEEIAAQALKKGALDYIKKPLKYSALSNIIQKALGERQRIKKQEQKLATLEHAYEKLQVSAESILQCMSAGVVAVDPELRIRIVNQKALELLHITNSNLVGQYFYQVFPMFRHTQLLIYTLQNKTSVKLYEIQVRVGREFKTININTDLIYDSGKNVIGAVATFDDITDLRHKEELLRERERLAIVGQMAAGMAHEIKNPLTAIKGFVQLLAAKSADPNLTSYLEIIENESNRMTQVIQDFLQLAKPKALEPRKMSVNQVLLEMVPVIEPMVILGGVTIELDIADNIPRSEMDPGQIKQVILNLCQNSIEAMDQGGILTLATRYLPETKEVQMDITDTGCGIALDKLKNLGVPFYTTKADGTGLGLSICFSILGKHRGRIEVQSKEGVGTTFSAFLPVLQ